MTYFNLIYAIGVEKFSKRCQEVGVDGLIIPDLPLEEEEEIAPIFHANGIALIRLVAPTSPKERIEKIAQSTEGFLYAVTVKGTTGARTEYEEGLPQYLKELKAVSNAPVLAGFGVSSPEQVKELSSYCDGVIVGSKIVSLLHKNGKQEIAELVAAAKNN